MIKVYCKWSDEDSERVLEWYNLECALAYARELQNSSTATNVYVEYTRISK